MAVTSRQLRSGRTLVKRTANKRVRKPAAKSPKRRAAPRPDPGIVELALAAFAHEVRTPLTGILAVSDLLATSDLDARERRWVDTIKAGAEHLAGLATLFVDAARSSASGLGVREDFFDLRALARNAADSLAGRAAAKGLQATAKISEKLPSFVVGDAVRLRAALENLVDNAVKFTEQGSVAIKVSTTRATRGKVGIVFAVSDSGIGLSLTEIKRLFRPFSQANVTIATRFGGAGLGLSSVRQIARAMGGDIAVAQRPGGGTTFTLTVALTRASGAPSITPGGVADGESPEDRGEPLHILSVEDNPFGRVVLNAVLTELGHRTEFVGRGELAASRVADGQFDAVLMDMVLPGISGIEAIRQIRALPGSVGRIAIIGVSGRDDDEIASRAAGADAFLLKPVSPRGLATALLEATRREAVAT
ncbi:CheY-like chemotaxis protein [Rhodopseudomonas rhenobacensis]|uniref:histidine kinase n=1 Tax=Rhodopseudomonas rhenobacensis TaxID=87461 RepID=A0A7W7YZW2_9BRAD|nr:ATP-binding protein [Rhodopseudomonas rhenobacensis]MBB5045299.1 CheY-like chemotaxis protein [Rhodopseudomonas rhenobacensis]